MNKVLKPDKALHETYSNLNGGAIRAAMLLLASTTLMNI